MEGNENTTQKDYYKILEVDYDATDEKIRLNYRRLALKWHPDKHKGDSAVTTKFQEINEAYNGNSHVTAVTIDDTIAMSRGTTDVVSLQYDDFCLYLFLLIFSSAVLRDPDKRFDYDLTGIYEIDKYTLREYLTRFKGMILTCNGLGIGNASICSPVIWNHNYMDAYMVYGEFTGIEIVGMYE
ncbi:hypothetical protein POTOM_059102 [Populus tomentosa]|uniref:J domain-containing protein n=1 Tax=Populus tomentosa TaxID=118781 RepID=A0A8X8C2T6_POPTO|nr:hypothetical protein POTOM_059102 [Populus tomentosa]